jgi:myosin heavy subunit
MAEKNAMKDLIIAHNQNIINEKLKLDVSSNLNAENKKLEQANIKVNETKIKYELEQKKLNEAINISNAKKSEFNKTLNEVKSKESDIANASVQTLSIVQNISKMLEEKNTNNPGKNKNKNLAANKNTNENIKDPSDEISKSFDASTTSSSGGAAGKGYVVASASAQSGISGNYEVVDNKGNKISLDGFSGFASENNFKFDAKKVNIGSKTSAGVEVSYDFDHETKGKDGSVNNIGYKVTIKSGADYDVGVKSDKNSGSVTGSASIGSSVSVDYKQGTFDKDGNGSITLNELR